MGNKIKNSEDYEYPIFIHSDILMSFTLYKDFIYKEDSLGFCDAANRYLIKEYGNNLIFPSFNYNFSDTKVFDVDNDKSQVGALSEFIRLTSDQYSRSLVPFFSILSKNDNLCQYSLKLTPFGERSFFEWLYHNNGRIVFFGSGFSFTFLHYIEGLIPGGPIYRYDKEFNGLLVTKGINKKVVCNMHVRPKGVKLEYDLDFIESDLRKNNILVGDENGIVFSLKCAEVVPYILSKYKNDPLYGLTNKSKLNFTKLTNNCKDRVKIYEYEL